MVLMSSRFTKKVFGRIRGYEWGMDSRLARPTGWACEKGTGVNSVVLAACRGDREGEA